MTSRSKLDAFSFIVLHGPKERQTCLLSKGTTSEGKIQGQKRFRQSNRGSGKSLFVRKTSWVLVAL